MTTAATAKPMNGIGQAELDMLKAPLDPQHVKWRAAENKISGKDGLRVLCYIDVRTVQDILDDVCGPQNWKVELQNIPDGSGLNAGISILIDRGNGTSEWVTKWDGADRSTSFDVSYQYQYNGTNKIGHRESKVEGVPTALISTFLRPGVNGDGAVTLKAVDIKGTISDAIKRAAVSWGIGRELYEAGNVYATLETQSFPGSHYIKIDGTAYYWRSPDYAQARSRAMGAQSAAGQRTSQPQGSSPGPAPAQGNGGQPRTFDNSQNKVCPKCRDQRLAPSKFGAGYYCYGCKQKVSESEYDSFAGGQSAPGNSQEPQSQPYAPPHQEIVDTSDVPF